VVAVAYVAYGLTGFGSTVIALPLLARACVMSKGLSALGLFGIMPRSERRHGR
jgi:hypothetical protein